jgi:hypothetical protein
MNLFIAQNRKSVAEFRHKFPAAGNTVWWLTIFGIPLQNYVLDLFITVNTTSKWL